MHVAHTNDINWNDHVRRWTTLQFWIAALRAEVPQTENLPKMPSGMKKIERESQTEGISFNKDSGWAGHPFTGCWGASMVHRALGYVAAIGHIGQNQHEAGTKILWKITQSYSVESGTQEARATKRSVQVTLYGSVQSLSLRPSEVCERSLCSPSGQRLCRDQQRQKHIVKYRAHTNFTEHYGALRTHQRVAWPLTTAQQLHSHNKRRASDGRQWDVLISDKLE